VTRCLSITDLTTCFLIGKSVLCSKLIEKIQSSEETTVLYFLCIDTRPESLHCQSLLHALAWQLIQKQRDLSAVVQHEFISQGHLATTRSVKRLLGMLLSAFPSVRIVVDGLDECDKKHQEDILDGGKGQEGREL
jgi:NACHT domain